MCILSIQIDVRVDTRLKFFVVVTLIGCILKSGEWHVNAKMILLPVKFWLLIHVHCWCCAFFKNMCGRPTNNIFHFHFTFISPHSKMLRCVFYRCVAVTRQFTVDIIN